LNTALWQSCALCAVQSAERAKSSVQLSCCRLQVHYAHSKSCNMLKLMNAEAAVSVVVAMKKCTFFGLHQKTALLLQRKQLNAR